MKKLLFFILLIVAVSISSYEDYKSGDSEPKKIEPKRSACDGLPEKFTRKTANKLVSDTEAAFEKADMLKNRAKHLYKTGQITASQYREAKEYRSLASSQRARAYRYAHQLELCYEEIVKVGTQEIERIKTEQSIK